MFNRSKNKLDDDDDEFKSESYRKKLKDEPRAKVKLFDKFRQGDVIFGLIAPRNAADKVLVSKGFKNTCANELNQPATDLLMRGVPKEQAIKKLAPTKYKHYLFLEQHIDYLKRKPGKTLPKMQAAPELGAAYRRACKLLLTNRAPERTYDAHVVTTDIDWSRVCDKKRSGLGITDSEMRAAYRDARLGPNPHIFFYDKDLNLLDTPPWEQPGIKEHFDHYESQRKLKP